MGPSYDLECRETLIAAVESVGCSLNQSSVSLTEIHQSGASLGSREQPVVPKRQLSSRQHPIYQFAPLKLFTNEFRAFNRPAEPT